MAELQEIARKLLVGQSELVKRAPEPVNPLVTLSAVTAVVAGEGVM